MWSPIHRPSPQGSVACQSRFSLRTNAWLTAHLFPLGSIRQKCNHCELVLGAGWNWSGLFPEEAGIIRADIWNEEESWGLHREEGEERGEELRRQRQTGKQAGRQEMSYGRGTVGLWKETAVPDALLGGCEEGLGHILKDGQAGSGDVLKDGATSSSDGARKYSNNTVWSRSLKRILISQD